jgi:3-oxoacyl-[acyl-carrier protein] reductase
MIIVTGASKGLGFSICSRLIQQGFAVLGLARNVEHLTFPAISCDVTQYPELKEVAKSIRSEKTRVTGLINAAGIASMNLALTTPPDLVSRIINVNLIGTIFSSQVFAPLMIREKSGQIINFSTIAVPLHLSGESIYSASKAGVESFTKSFAKELSSFGIRVNCVAPGPIQTDLIKGISAQQIKAVVSSQIIQDQMSKDDVCDLIELLLDDRAKSLSGQVLNVGGVG